MCVYMNKSCFRSIKEHCHFPILLNEHHHENKKVEENLSPFFFNFTNILVTYTPCKFIVLSVHLTVTITSSPCHMTYFLKLRNNFSYMRRSKRSKQQLFFFIFYFRSVYWVKEKYCQLELPL